MRSARTPTMPHAATPLLALLLPLLLLLVSCCYQRHAAVEAQAGDTYPYFESSTVPTSKLPASVAALSESGCDVRAVQEDSTGNVFMLMSCTYSGSGGSMSFGGPCSVTRGVGTNSAAQAILLKVTSTGCAWANAFSSTDLVGQSSIVPKDLVVDAAGDVIISVQHDSSKNIGLPGSVAACAVAISNSASSNQDTLFFKYRSSDGVCIWGTRVSTTSSGIRDEMAATRQGIALVPGSATNDVVIGVYGRTLSRTSTIDIYSTYGTSTLPYNADASGTNRNNQVGFFVARLHGATGQYRWGRSEALALADTTTSELVSVVASNTSVYVHIRAMAGNTLLLCGSTPTSSKSDIIYSASVDSATSTMSCSGSPNQYVILSDHNINTMILDPTNSTNLLVAGKFTSPLAWTGCGTIQPSDCTANRCGGSEAFIARINPTAASFCLNSVAIYSPASDEVTQLAALSSDGTSAIVAVGATGAQASAANTLSCSSSALAGTNVSLTFGATTPDMDNFYAAVSYADLKCLNLNNTVETNNATAIISTRAATSRQLLAAGQFRSSSTNILQATMGTIVGNGPNVYSMYAWLACPAGTYRRATDQLCASCPKGRYQTSSHDGTICADVCPAGTFGNVTGGSSMSMSCARCPADTYSSSTGSTACTDCPAGSFYYPQDPNIGATSDTDCVTPNCPIGTFFNFATTQCEGCPAGQYQDQPNQATCKLCPRGYSCASASAPSPCDAGYYQDEEGKTTCKECGTGRFNGSPSRTTACDVCQNAQFANGTTQSACHKCPAGTRGSGLTEQASQDTACASCSQGQYQDLEGQATCKGCGAGNYSAATGASSQSVCTACPVGTWSNSSAASSCTDCGLGKYNPNTGSSDISACQSCPSGRFGNGTALASCYHCPVGTRGKGSTGSVSESDGCTACSQGQYQDLEGQPTCKDCGAGNYSTATGATTFSVCTACPVGTWSNSSAASSCMDCGLGKYNPNTGSIDVIACKGCAVGTFGNGSALASCYSCSAGSRGIGAGNATSESTGCGSCLAGQYQDQEGQAQCKDCGAGNYSAATGATSQSVCTACPVGTWSNSSAASSCTDCGLGKYNPNTGSANIAACLNCDVGKFGNGTALASCYLCPAGTRGKGSGGASSRADGCGDCLAGQYQDLEGQTVCKDCGAGYYSPNTAAISSSVCQKCPSGTWNSAPAVAACTGCSVGTNSSAVGASTNVCAACHPGQYQDVTGQAECKLCMNGTFSAAYGANSSDTCQSCPAGQWQNLVGQLQCELCPTGTNSSAMGAVSVLTCRNCPIGYYQNEQGKAVCKACDANKYQSIDGQSGCDACDGTKVSHAGASRCYYAPPTSVATTLVGKTIIRFQWSAPTGSNGQPIPDGTVTYKALYRTAGSSNWVTGPSGLTTTQAELQGLTPNTGYELGAMAVGSDALDNSAIAEYAGTVTTQNYGSPDSPANLRVGLPNKYSVQLLWDPITDIERNGGALISYHNVTVINGTSGDVIEVVTSSGAGGTFTVTRLKPNTLYKFNVYSVNAQGFSSAPTSDISVQTLSVEAVDSSTVTFSAVDTGSFEISWTDIAGASGYTIYVVESTASLTSERSLFTASHSNVLVQTDNLKPGFRYNVTVVTHEDDRTSVRSLPASVTLVPQPPSGLALSTTVLSTSSSIAVKHNAAIVGADVPLSYAISYRRQSGGSATLLTASSGIARTVSGLQAGTKYMFKVQTVVSEASGATRSSAFSAEVEASTTLDAVENLHVDTATTTTATLSWSAPLTAVDGAPLIEYKVLVNGTVRATQATTSITVNSLSSSNTHAISVVAVNAGGDSMASQVQAFTKPLPPTGLSVFARNDTSISARWTAPTVGDLFISKYRVTIHEDVSASPAVAQDTTAIEHVFGSLTPSATHTVTVLAENSKSLQSSVVTLPNVITLPLPPVVSIAASNRSSIAVQVQPPAIIGDVALVSYVVTLTNVATQTSSVVTLDAAGTSSVAHQFGGLSVSTAYSATATVSNSQGVSRVSVAVQRTTDSAVEPAAPLSIIVSAVTQTNFTVSWQVPADDGGSDIARHVVKLLDASTQAEVARLMTADGSSTSLFFKHDAVQPDTSYLVTVAAENAVGSSVDGQPVSFRTLAMPPTPPPPPASSSPQPPPPPASSSPQPPPPTTSDGLGGGEGPEASNAGAIVGAIIGSIAGVGAVAVVAGVGVVSLIVVIKVFGGKIAAGAGAKAGAAGANVLAVKPNVTAEQFAATFELQDIDV